VVLKVRRTGGQTTPETESTNLQCTANMMRLGLSADPDFRPQTPEELVKLLTGAGLVTREGKTGGDKFVVNLRWGETVSPKPSPPSETAPLDKTEALGMAYGQIEKLELHHLLDEGTVRRLFGEDTSEVRIARMRAENMAAIGDLTGPLSPEEQFRRLSEAAVLIPRREDTLTFSEDWGREITPEHPATSFRFTPVPKDQALSRVRRLFELRESEGLLKPGTVDKFFGSNG